MICKVKFWKQIGEIAIDWECKSIMTDSSNTYPWDLVSGLDW